MQAHQQGRLRSQRRNSRCHTPPVLTASAGRRPRQAARTVLSVGSLRACRAATASSCAANCACSCCPSPSLPIVRFLLPLQVFVCCQKTIRVRGVSCCDTGIQDFFRPRLRRACSWRFKWYDCGDLRDGSTHGQWAPQRPDQGQKFAASAGEAVAARQRDHLPGPHGKPASDPSALTEYRSLCSVLERSTVTKSKERNTCWRQQQAA